MKKSVNIAVTGKGGTGKSTISALLLKALLEKPKGLVLAIDADPNYNLDMKLGVKVRRTIGNLREEMREKGDETPAGMSKSQFVEYQLRVLLEEEEGFDLLTMGRQEGPGCYCYINNVLRHFIDTLSKDYSYIIIDNDAGMEHLSRRTDQHMDYLIIATDATKVGLETAARIRDMAVEMDLVHGTIIPLVNSIRGEMPEYLKAILENYSFDNILTIPYDEKLFQLNSEGLSLMDLPPDSPAFEIIRGMIQKHQM